MKGFLIKNIYKTSIELNINNGLVVDIEPNNTYFYTNELLTGQIKIMEKKNMLSVEYIKNFYYKIDTEKNKVNEPKVINRKKRNNKKI